MQGVYARLAAEARALQRGWGPDCVGEWWGCLGLGFVLGIRRILPNKSVLYFVHSRGVFCAPFSRGGAKSFICISKAYKEGWGLTSHC